MRFADLKELIGIPYDKVNYDCADFVVDVQKRVFDRDVQFPTKRPRGQEGERRLENLSKEYVQKTDSPKDGDLVLMYDFGRSYPSHVGVYFWLSHEGWVFHSNSKNGSSVLHRVRDLPEFGVRIEGYYQWL